MYRKVESRKVYPLWCAGIPANELPTTNQWYFYSQNIRKVTLKMIYFHYLKESFLDQSITKKHFV